MTWDEQNGQDGGGKGPWGARNAGKKDKPGGGGKGPWEPGGGGEPPPDLEELLRQAQERFGGMFGGGSPAGGAGDGKKTIGIVLLALLLLWLATGFYRVLPEENAIILTFGKWTSTRSAAGLGYTIPWPVQDVMKVNVAFDRRVEIGSREQPPRRSSRGGGEAGGVFSESQMLTGDENIVDINFVVMWRIGDAKKYLFQIRDPETTVKKVAESAMRETIARSKIQKALTEGRADIEAQTKKSMQDMLDEYQSGVVINNVQLLRVDPPAPVVDAFDDVQRARADRERAKNEAETYRNDIVPRARGDAQKLLQDAEAYREAVLSKAKGEADRFLSVYTAYAAAKTVTARRMYIETMQQIMQGSKKVLMSDGKTGSLLPYMPLEQMQGRAVIKPPSQ